MSETLNQRNFKMHILLKRNVFTCLGNYRFGFNGQEKDDEIAGEGNINTAMYWEYDTRLGRRWNLDPKPVVGLSEYACFANNPIWYRDINGDSPTWHQDKAGNLVADEGDNEYTLQNFIWVNAGTTINVQQAKALLRTLLNNEPYGITNIAGHRIYLNDVRKIAGSHISTMLNSGVKAVHKGQRAFLESKPVQFTLTVMSFFIPAAGMVRAVRATETALTHWAGVKLVSKFLGNLYAFGVAYDKAAGTNIFNRNSIPAEIADNIGYPGVAKVIDTGMSIKNGAGNIKSGNILEATDDFNDIYETSKKGNSEIKSEKENTGYEGSK